MTRITITKARGGFIVEGTDATEPSVAVGLPETLAIVATMLTRQAYGSNDLGGVVLLTPIEGSSESDHLKP